MTSMRDFANSFDVDAYQQRRRIERGLSRLAEPPKVEERKPRKAEARNVMSEHDEQCRVICWRNEWHRHYPGLELLHAIPNGGQRSKAQAGKLRAEGVLAGVCDLFLPVARRGFHGLYIEMKSLIGTTTDNQDKFIQSVQAQGFYAECCKGADDAIGLLKWYLTEAN